MKAVAKKTPALSLDKLSYVIFYVKDVLKSVAYYRDTLGMKVKGEANEYWTEFDAGACTVALHKANGQVTTGKEISTPVFEVKDVRAAHAALKAAGVKASDLHQVCEVGDQVGMSSDFADPDGNRLSIYGMVKKA